MSSLAQTISEAVPLRHYALEPATLQSVTAIDIDLAGCNTGQV
jgi:hypothetical protein